MSAKPKIATRESIAAMRLSAGQMRLWRFADAARRGVAPDPVDVQALAVAFRAILKGVDPKKALAIGGKQHQGRRELTASEADVDLPSSVDVQRYRDVGMTRDDAVAKVAGETAGKRFDKVMRLYKRDGHAARQILAMIEALDPDAEPLRAVVRWLNRTKK